MAVVTIRDVADAAGVSVATVSRVLNGVATVDPDLAAQVRAAADSLGYVPNGVGRALRLQQMNAWALVVSELNAFISSLVASIEAAAEEVGTSVYLGITGYDREREQRYLRAARSQRVSGLIAGYATGPDQYRDAGIPLVSVDRWFPGAAHDSVATDNRAAGRLMAGHLHERGLRRAACIGHLDPGTPVAERIEGFRDAWLALGLPAPVEQLGSKRPGIADGKAAMQHLLSSDEPPEAVFCANGPLTQGAYLGLQCQGAAPVALTGVDDEEWTSLASPSITVVRQPVREIGRATARLLTERIAGATGPARQVVIAPDLVIRASTAPR
ncbi:MAG: LacI family DNA-binding transcriptional regulator [Arachnia sp.]